MTSSSIIESLISDIQVKRKKQNGQSKRSNIKKIVFLLLLLESSQNYVISDIQD
jgi:hypothetical protein